MTRLEIIVAGLGSAALIAFGLWAGFSPEDKPSPPVVTEQPAPVVVPITPPESSGPSVGEPPTGQPEPVVPQEETKPAPVPPVAVQPQHEKPVVKPHNKKPVKHKCQCKKKYCNFVWPKPDQKHYFYAY